MRTRSGFILNITNDSLTQGIIDLILKNHGYQSVGVKNPDKALEVIEKKIPDLVLFDGSKKGMGFDRFSKIIRADRKRVSIPLFLMGETKPADGKAAAFPGGTANWLLDPVNRAFFLKMVGTYLGGKKEPPKPGRPMDVKLGSPWFALERFKMFLKIHFKLPDSYEERIENLSGIELYSFGEEIGVGGDKMANLMAAFLNIPFLGYFHQDEIKRGVLSEEFCKKKWVLPLKGKHASVSFAIGDPFDLGLIDDLQKIAGSRENLEIGVTPLHYLDIFLENEEIDLEVIYPEGMPDFPRPDWGKSKRSFGGTNAF